MTVCNLAKRCWVGVSAIAFLAGATFSSVGLFSSTTAVRNAPPAATTISVSHARTASSTVMMKPDCYIVTAEKLAISGPHSAAVNAFVARASSHSPSTRSIDL